MYRREKTNRSSGHGDRKPWPFSFPFYGNLLHKPAGKNKKQQKSTKQQLKTTNIYDIIQTTNKKPKK
ncbi:MAG: hypothetical protein HFG77_09905 [Hungatella sp.]|nr:hypothetical protein [Hungatella sp.]